MRRKIAIFVEKPIFMELNVALWQSDPVWRDKRANLERLEEVVRDTDADMIIAPEMFATGFSVGDTLMAEPAAESLTMHFLRRIAVRYGKAVAGSAAISEGGSVFNRLIFAKPSGETLVYDKRHLFSPGGEARFFTRGGGRVVAEFKGMRFLLLVCYDLRFPVWSRRRGDYDAIIYVASWDSRRRDAWRTLLRARAIENQSYVLGVNRAGDDPQTHYAGDSAAIDYMGRTMSEAGEGEKVLRVTLSADDLHAFRDRFAAWRDADDFDLRA